MRRTWCVRTLPMAGEGRTDKILAGVFDETIVSFIRDNSAALRVQHSMFTSNSVVLLTKRQIPSSSPTWTPKLPLLKPVLSKPKPSNRA